MTTSRSGIAFQDFFPSMIGQLGAEGFFAELCNGFQLLMDREKGVITYESLKKNSAVLGVEDLREDELMCMLREGDLDGDGALNRVEFCILMLRMSPGFIGGSRRVV